MKLSDYYNVESVRAALLERYLDNWDQQHPVKQVGDDKLDAELLDIRADARLAMETAFKTGFDYAIRVGDDALAKIKTTA